MKLIVLDATNKTLTLQVYTAAVLGYPTAVVSYADTTATTILEGSTATRLTSTDQTTILSAPASSTQRVVRSITIFNEDIVVKTMVLSLVVGGTSYMLYKITLPGEGTWSSDDLSGVNVGGAVTDGSKGDIVVSSGGDTWSIATAIPGQGGAVTLAKMANLATDKLIGRDTAGDGAPEAIGVTGGIEFNGSGSIQVGAFSGDVGKLAGDPTLTITAGAVTTTKLGGDITTAGKALLDDADAAAQRTTLGLGSAAVTNVRANTNIEPTTANQTAAVNTRYFATIAGLTNHRDFVLPTPAIGDEVELSIVDGDDVYSLIIVPISASVTINNGRAAISVTASTSTDAFTATKHGLLDGDPVRFAGTTLPGNITAGTMYYVRDAAADTFKVATARGNAAIDLTTTNGSGITVTPQEWSRLFIKNEYIRLVANSTTNWQVVVDGRISQAAELESRTAQSVANATEVRLTMGTKIADNASIADTSTSIFTPRRTGAYTVTGGVRIDFTVYSGTLQANVRTVSGANVVLLDNRYSVGFVPAALFAGVVNLTAGTQYEFIGFHNTGVTQSTYMPNNNRVFLSMVEVI